MINICIPYQNMKLQFDVFVNYFLKHNSNNIIVNIIEQENEDKHFNSGKLTNIGFKLKNNSHIFMLHPIDLYPKHFDEYI